MTSMSHGLLTAYRVFGPLDVKNIRREDLLMWMGGLMGVVVVLYRYGVPALAGLIDARLGFDLTPYYDLIMSPMSGSPRAWLAWSSAFCCSTSGTRTP